MRKLTVLLVLVAGMAHAEEADKKKAGGAVEKARAVVDASDKAFNDRDAAALIALLDKSYFGAGPTLSAKQDDLAAAKVDFERELARGGKLTRESITMHPDDAGNTVWYIADYTYVPKVGPGVLPVHRKVRQSGVVVKRGKDWKIAEWHTAFPMPDPPAPAAPPPAAPGAPAAPKK
jgi:hypothetical protein